jgi:uncharacterized protein YndB with AHSA1/START domain
MSDTDVIEKKVSLKAPRSRVWRAVSSPAEFGAWFGVSLEGQIAAGSTLRGKLSNPDYAHLTLEMRIEKVEPERYLSYRWHPNAIDVKRDYSAEPTTLVEFELEDAGGGTLLTIRESGFDALPESRRAEAFRGNDRGWGIQAENVARHVAG